MKKLLHLIPLVAMLLFAKGDIYTMVEDPVTGNVLPVNVKADYPLIGQYCIVVDDGYDWTPIFAESLAVKNAYYRLTGTPYELGFTVIINQRNGATGAGNAISNWDGNPTASTVMDYQELRSLASHAFVEIGNHGYTADITDPFGGGSGTATEVHSIRKTHTGDSTNVRMIYIDGVKCMVDSLYLPQPTFHGQNGHRVSAMEWYYAVKAGIKNMRVGTWRYANNGSYSINQWYTGANDDNSTNGERGLIQVPGRQNLDAFAYWFSGYDKSAIDLIHIFTPINRLNLPHVAPASSVNYWGETFSTRHDRWLDAIDLVRHCADNKQTAIWTLHDITDDGNNQYFGGVDSLVVLVEDYIVPLALNGLNKLDGPSVKMAKVSEAMEMRMDFAHSTAPKNVIDNLMLEEGTLVDGVPYGWPDLSATWSDSSITYVPPETADDPNGWFGMNNDGGLFGCIADAGGFHSLVGVFPVRGGAIGNVWCYASAETLRASQDSVAQGYVGKEWIDIKVTPYRFNFDYSDTSYTFGITGAANGPEEEIWDFGFRQTSTDWQGVSTSTGMYDISKMENRFHSRDSWRYNRASLSSVVTFFNRASDTGNTDAGQRWRQFSKQFRIPHDANWVKVEFIPTGFAPVSGDSLGIAGIGFQLIPY